MKPGREKYSWKQKTGNQIISNKQIGKLLGTVPICIGFCGPLLTSPDERSGEFGSYQPSNPSNVRIFCWILLRVPSKHKLWEFVVNCGCHWPSIHLEMMLLEIRNPT